MTPEAGIRAVEGLLREYAPRALAIVASRYRDFDGAEDAVQEALIAAAEQWPAGVPDDPRAWLVTVASRRLVDAYRSADARRRREREAWDDREAPAADEPVTGDVDDSLTLVLLCCHPALTPGTAIPLTLRAVGGLTTREIAAAFLVPEATMAQRISRAKATLRAAGGRFEPPPDDARDARTRSALHVLYLMFNEGYVASEGDDLARPDLAAEAIRLTRMLRASLPADAEVAGLLALMLLTEARRQSRVDDAGRLVPLPAQDRTRWNPVLIAEGVVLLTDAMRRGEVGEYQLQAAIAAVHDQAPSYADTDWTRIAGLYRALARLTDNPMVGLNAAVAVAMTDGIPAAMEHVDAASAVLGDHHRVHAVRAHLHELAGEPTRAADEFRAAAARTANEAERRYLADAASRLSGSAGEEAAGISVADVENGGSAPTP
ncbi:RNA polymerase sigma factor [Microbacterium sp. NPDC058389]|uniref:RNA polymerase sigma factor n=1 Tax=Microbacterium sp. NPDC058389 TaxID=3346475 RepID=UPI00364AE3B6